MSDPAPKIIAQQQSCPALHTTAVLHDLATALTSLRRPVVRFFTAPTSVASWFAVLHWFAGWLACLETTTSAPAPHLRLACRSFPDRYTLSSNPIARWTLFALYPRAFLSSSSPARLAERPTAARPSHSLRRNPALASPASQKNIHHHCIFPLRT